MGWLENPQLMNYSSEMLQKRAGADLQSALRPVVRKPTNLIQD